MIHIILQYQYYILPVLGEEAGEACAAHGNPVYGSKMMICIDPGHYGSENVVYAENSESDHYYAEGLGHVSVMKATGFFGSIRTIRDRRNGIPLL